MSALRELAARVGALQPGESLDIKAGVLRDVPPLHHNGATWTPEERVLENVIGSAYGWRAVPNPFNGVVTFERCASVPDGARTYVAPDRRDLFVLGPDGFWRLP